MIETQDVRQSIDRDTARIMLHRLTIARGIEDLFEIWVKDGTFSGWWHPGRGQEGAAVGAMTALGADDQIMWYHRGTNWPIARGMNVELVIADLLGRTNGSTKGKGGGAPHWVDMSLGLIGSGGTLGTAHVIGGGLALAKQVLGKPGIVVAGFGDGTAARGTFHETLMQAVPWKLPLLYFCENNGYAVATAFKDTSPTPTVAERASAYGIPGVHVDGQDPVAVYHAVRDARAYIAAGNGPMIVEAKTYRRGGHYFGDVGAYRDPDEFAEYRDPIAVMRSYFDDPAEIEAIEAAAHAELEGAAARALAGPVPGREVIFQNIYAEQEIS